VFERAFKDFGLPCAIRTETGLSFASASAIFGLSKLPVWWLRLGIGIERIKPGNPQQSGRHERMRLTLKKEATRPAGENFLQQQAKFDRFIQCYNYERAHQALNMKYPAELYTPSRRPYKGLCDLEYPFHDRTITVTSCGGLNAPSKSGVFLSSVGACPNSDSYLIRGSGGIRRVRWAAQGKGKRGGLRVIYYWITHRGHLLLLTLYRKFEVSDLTPGEVRALRALVENLEN
jgi:hypothetical protein